MAQAVYTLKSIEETRQFAEKFFNKSLRNIQKDCAVVVLLSGDLGSGKTTFTREFSRVLGITKRVASPTFVIEKRYPIKIPDILFQRLVHIDAYRLEGDNASETLSLKETFSDPKNVILIEWPENIKNAIPYFDFKISFEFVDDNTRKAVLEEPET